MKTHPDKCRDCVSKDTDPKKEPCFTCVGADAFEESIVGRQRRLYKEARARKVAFSGCYGGRACYCAPFEDVQE